MASKKNTTPAAEEKQQLDTAEVIEATTEEPAEAIPAETIENPAPAAESDDGFARVIYIGVTIGKLGLVNNSIYKLDPATMPIISAAKKKYPVIERLLIPVEEYTPMHKHTHRAFYNKLAEAVGASKI